MTRHRSGSVRRLRLVACLLVGALVGPVGVHGPVSAASASNIPGIPLPGPAVTGDLGGSIYDVVYRVFVPSGNVLLASMTGDAGTDFDLYLFDSTATDVYADPPVGLVAKSTGPTSTESISYPSVTGGTYFIDLAGFSTTMGRYQLTVRIAPDTTPPAVVVLLGGGAPATNDPVVTATVLATDDLSGVDSMQLSLDGVEWTAWAPYAAVVLWTFAPPDGLKDFHVRVRDRAGNVSPVAHDGIELDTASPTILSVSPEAGTGVAGLRPTFVVRFSEPLRASSWLVNGLTVRDPYGTAIYGALTYDPGTSSGTFVPDSALAPGQPYQVQVGNVTDIAGNLLAAFAPWTVVPLTPTQVTLSASASLVARGASVTLDGRLVSVSGAAVTVEQSVGDSPFEPIVPLLTADGGTFRTIVAVSANTRFRVVYAGSGTVAGSVSPSVRVLVRRVVALAGRSPGLTKVVSRGRAVSLRAVLTPVAPDIVITFRIYRRDPATGRLILKTTVARTSVNGTASWQWVPTVAGRYTIRLSTPPTALFANGISAAYAWTVR